MGGSLLLLFFFSITQISATISFLAPGHFLNTYDVFLPQDLCSNPVLFACDLSLTLLPLKHRLFPGHCTQNRSLLHGDITCVIWMEADDQQKGGACLCVRFEYDHMIMV